MYTDEDLNAQLNGTVAPIDPTAGALPPQTAINPLAYRSMPKPDDNAPLPVVPRGQLAQWIKEHQKEEEDSVPSGRPSDEDQQHADVSRGIGNATASFLSGIQNTIGILKPGSANYSQAELAQKQGEQYAQQALQKAPQARQEAIQNMSLGAMQDEKRQKQMQMIQALKQQQEENDPKSQRSEAARNELLNRMNTYAQVEPSIADAISNYVPMLAHLSASQIKDLESKDFIGKIVGERSNERAAGNANQVKQDIAKGSLGLGYKQEARQERKDEAEEDIKRQALAQQKIKAEVTHRKAQEKLNGQISDLDQADQSLASVIELKKKGGVNTGPVTNWVANKAEMADLTSSERNQMKAKLANVINNELHKLSGAAISESEWERLRAQMPLMSNDDGVFMDRVNTMRQQLQQLKALRTKEYQESIDHDLIDQSNTAKDAVALKKSRTTPTQAAPDHSAAIKWAKEHPDDPRAAQILKLNGVQ